MVRRGIAITFLFLSCVVTTGKLKERESYIREDIEEIQKRIEKVERELMQVEEDISTLKRERLFDLNALVVEVDAKVNRMERNLREIQGEVEEKDFLLSRKVDKIKREIEGIKSFLGEEIYVYLAKRGLEADDCNGIADVKLRYTMKYPSGKYLNELSYFLGKCYEKEGRFKEALKEYGVLISKGKGERYCEAIEGASNIMKKIGKKKEAEVLRKKWKETCKK